MKWPFDPQLLTVLQGLFVVFLLGWALGCVIVAWVLISTSIVMDLTR